MKVKERNYFGFNHEKVNEKFTGGLTYIGDIALSSGYAVALYHVDSPDRAKGHKRYVTLSYNNGLLYIGGLTPQKAKKEAIHDAVLCTECNTVLYSVHRHDYHICDCENKTMVDGGKEYLRCGGNSIDKVVAGKYNVLTKKFKKDRKKK